MNDTKWNEIFTAFYKAECAGNPSARWRTKDLTTGFLSEWDGTWTHFGCQSEDWKHIDCLQIELTAQNEAYVLRTLRKIHVPGSVLGGIVTIYGYKPDADYIV